MPITKDEWAEIENKLKSLYCDIRFTLDGRKVTVQKQMISDNQLGLAVFIDGVLRGGADMPRNEQYDPLTQKVWRRISRNVDPFRKLRKQKDHRLKPLQKQLPDPPPVLVLYSPLFYTSKSFLSHYKKIEGLELCRSAD